MQNIGNRLSELCQAYYEPGMRVLEKVSLIGLGALALKRDKKLLIPFFGIGMLFGRYHYFKNRKCSHQETPRRQSEESFNQETSCCPHPQENSDLSKCHPTSLSCSQGLLEQTSGIRLPAPISLLVNAALIVDHLSDHHLSKSYVSIIGVYLGAWVGKECASLLFRVSKHQ